ncbi:MAG: PilZ domain-containing protein [Pseudohongiellaceae bacterium]
MSVIQKQRGGDGSARQAGQGILSLSIREKSVLYAAYMPFIRNGGLFIPTTREYEIGNEVFMLLRLLDEEEKLPVAGRVIWITPARAQSNRAAGIGVQFNDPDGVARQRIEKLLAGFGQERPTHTL